MLYEVLALALALVIGFLFGCSAHKTFYLRRWHRALDYQRRNRQALELKLDQDQER